MTRPQPDPDAPATVPDPTTGMEYLPMREWSRGSNVNPPPEMIAAAEKREGKKWKDEKAK